MPVLTMREAPRTQTVGIYRVIGQNDEAITSPLYADRLVQSLARIYDSSFWRSTERFADARRRLNATVALMQGWDTYDAESPNDVSRLLAGRILNILETASLPPTSLTPNVEGGVAMSFVEGGKRAVIEVYNTGEVAAATYSNDCEPAVWELDANDLALQRAIDQIRVHLAT